MKRTFTMIIGVVAVAGLVTAVQHVAAQSEPEDAGFEPLVAFFMDEAPDEDAQFGWPGPRGPRGGAGDAFPPGLFEKLELTDQQQIRLKNLRNTFEKETARLRADLEVAHIELREVMSGTNPSVSEAKSKAADVNEARAKLFERTVTFRVEAKNVLTSEQQKTLEEEGHRIHGPRGGAMHAPRGRAFGRYMMGPPSEAPQTPER